MRTIEIDAAKTTAFKDHKGLGGVPGPVAAHPEFPDMTPLWRQAGSTLVRSYDWLSRLDTVDNPESLFPDWSADPADPASYNFAQTDEWVAAVHATGADVLFTISSSIPQNKAPVADVAKYGVVVEHIVRHYAQSWAGGPTKSVRMFEFWDQPDFGPLHFSGTPEQFYEMYESFARAVKRVDPSLQAGGTSLAFPLNQNAPYREGFLSFVQARGLPLDFFSFLWFVDASRDPKDFEFVADQLRGLLDGRGLRDTKLVLSYWNYMAIPSNDAPAREKAAFQAAAAIYLQDTAIDRALFFRADSGRDPHYDFIDPAGLYDGDGNPDERAAAFAMIGQAMSGRRLAASGSDTSGFACIAGTDDQCIRVLISNFVAPESALERRHSDDFKFRIPIGKERIELSFRLAPQREALASAKVEAASVTLRNIPWAGDGVAMIRKSFGPENHQCEVLTRSENGNVTFTVDTPPQSVTLIELRPHDN